MILMSTIEAIENAIEKLSPHDLIKFRRWFQDFDASSWDEQIELDAASGKLDAVRDAALNESMKARRGSFEALFFKSLSLTKTHNMHAHSHRPVAFKNVCRHERPMFRERVWR
jgi:hypothetical protein